MAYTAKGPIREMARQYFAHLQEAHELADPNSPATKQCYSHAARLEKHLFKHANGRALLIGDIALVPKRGAAGGELELLTVFDLDFEGVEVDRLIEEIAGLARKAYSGPDPSVRLRMLGMILRRELSVTTEESTGLVDEILAGGFSGDRDEFVQIAKRILERRLAPPR